ncbi:aldehyde dehydrogenase family protein, partial [Litorivicinus sp.]|nr:aldehyde dehydrogenase family protein [Litorivicinus sp.]
MLLKKFKTRELIEINHYIGGQFQIPSSGEYFDSEDPYTGEVWARVARGNNDDANLAVDNASRAFDSWASLKPSERGRFLYRLADEIE